MIDDAIRAVGRRAAVYQTDSMWKRYRIVDEDNIEQALTPTQEYVSQQAAETKKAKVVSLAEGSA